MTPTSDNRWPWDVLDIAPYADERAVRRAYARLLKRRRPDEDADAFQHLRYAYESALHMVSDAAAGAAAGADAGVDASQAWSATARGAAHVPAAFDAAVQIWQDFVAKPERIESRRALRELFASIVHIPTREELEWQALCHCLADTVPLKLRLNLSALLGWRESTEHLRKRNAAIADLALERVFADEDYDALRQRFRHAMTLLEGPVPPIAAGTKILLRTGARAEMEQLLASLRREHANVVRHRLDSGKIEFWRRCLHMRMGLLRIAGPVLALSAWCGVLFAGASLRFQGEAAFDQWAVPQWAIVLSTVTLAFAALVVLAVLPLRHESAALTDDEPQPEHGWHGWQTRRTWRSAAGLRYGWIALWLGASSAALCDDGGSAGTALALGALGVSTIWAALIHGWPQIRQLSVLAVFSAIASGFMGHWMAIDPTSLPIPLAHGVLFAFFVSAAQPEWRARLSRRRGVSIVLTALWFAGFVTLIALLLAREPRCTQFAWVAFVWLSVMAGVLAKARWAELRDAVPVFYRAYAVLVWLALAVWKPDVAACVCAGVMCWWVIRDVAGKASASNRNPTEAR